MPQFFISTLGGAYCLVEHSSIADLEDDIVNPAHGDRFIELIRPDGKHILVDHQQVVLIQPPAPAAFLKIPNKEQNQ